MTRLDKLTMESEERFEILIARMTEIRTILKHSKNKKKIRKNMKAYFKCLTAIYGENIIEKEVIKSFIDDLSSDILSPTMCIEMLSSMIRVTDAEKSALETIRNLRTKCEMAYIKKQILQDQMN